MLKILRSYLKYVSGEAGMSIWSLLYPLQFLMSSWMRLRIKLYDRGVLSVTEPVLPVISVGNNSLGGTNKTPMTELIVRQLSEAGIEAGLVSSGYRTKEHKPLWIGQDEASLHRDIAGDEPLMLAKRLPGVKVVVSRDRVEGVAMLAALGVKVAVTDDTFQHRRMARDVDIVLVDATCPFGNGNVLPAGMMREPKSAFGRADIIVITKSNQVTDDDLGKTRKELEKFISPENIFTAEIKLESWLELSDGTKNVPADGDFLNGKFIAFSAIGNPAGFYKFLEDMGVSLLAHRSYRDHHIFTEDDIKELGELAERLGADGFICTEKDVVNLRENPGFGIPVYVPGIAVSLNEDMRFRRIISDKLKPRILVASNGYGEDAIGVVLAKKMRARFGAAEVSAFSFVGSGTHYKKEGFDVLSPVSDMPSGGVVKYSILALINDLRHGLGSSIRSQIRTLHSLRCRYRTPVCVGDVYLLANMLWGLGLKPLMLATAKSVHLHGHFCIERIMFKSRSRFVWTRDAETAEELQASGINAGFCGNPIMDLIEKEASPSRVWDECTGARVILLPGSRPRAYEDVNLILDAAKNLNSRMECCFVMVPAPMIDVGKLAGELEGWNMSSGRDAVRSHNGTYVRIFKGELSDVAFGADVVIGLGGTANQLCAGLGVPVVSIIEEGKLRQKKLLKEAEILVKADPSELAAAAEQILTTPKMMEEMRAAGIRHLGGAGVLDKVVEYCAATLGWDNRCFVYEAYRKYLDDAALGKLRSDKEMVRIDER